MDIKNRAPEGSAAQKKPNGSVGQGGNREDRGVSLRIDSKFREFHQNGAGAAVGERVRGDDAFMETKPSAFDLPFLANLGAAIGLGEDQTAGGHIEAAGEDDVGAV